MLRLCFLVFHQATMTAAAVQHRWQMHTLHRIDWQMDRHDSSVPTRHLSIGNVERLTAPVHVFAYGKHQLLWPAAGRNAPRHCQLSWKHFAIKLPLGPLGFGMPAGFPQRTPVMRTVMFVKPLPLLRKPTRFRANLSCPPSLILIILFRLAESWGGPIFAIQDPEPFGSDWMV